MPPNTVKVDRTTKWGNPFVDYPTRAAQTERFRAAVIGPVLDRKQCSPDASPESYIGRIIANAHNLRGKNLACWCSINRAMPTCCSSWPMPKTLFERMSEAQHPEREWVDVTVVGGAFEVQMDTRAVRLVCRHRKHGETDWQDGRPPHA